MYNWQPIETAPKDGTRVMKTRAFEMSSLGIGPILGMGLGNVSLGVVAANPNRDAPDMIPTPEIRALTERLAEESAKLQTAAGNLAERIAPVLRAETQTHPSQPAYTDLGRALTQLAENLMCIRLAIDAVAERVEL